MIRPVRFMVGPSGVLLGRQRQRLDYEPRLGPSDYVSATQLLKLCEVRGQRTKGKAAGRELGRVLTKVQSGAQICVEICGRPNTC
jgi:hypothetical protein